MHDRRSNPPETRSGLTALRILPVELSLSAGRIPFTICKPSKHSSATVKIKNKNQEIGVETATINHSLSILAARKYATFAKVILVDRNYLDIENYINLMMF